MIGPDLRRHIHVAGVRLAGEGRRPADADRHEEVRDSCDDNRSYEKFPTILMMAMAAQKAAIGRAAPLSILLATQEAIERDPFVLPGPIWRTPTQSGRLHWPKSVVA